MLIQLFLPLILRNHLLVRIKDHAKASTAVRKSNARTPTPSEQIKVEPSIAMVKDLLVNNIDGHVIYFCDEAARICRSILKIHIDLLLAGLLFLLK